MDRVVLGQLGDGRLGLVVRAGSLLSLWPPEVLIVVYSERINSLFWGRINFTLF